MTLLRASGKKRSAAKRRIFEAVSEKFCVNKIAMLFKLACAKRCTFDCKKSSRTDLNVHDTGGEVALRFRMWTWIIPIAWVGKPNILNDKRLRMLLE